MDKIVKYSRQREALLELLRSVKNHPTADWLYTELKKRFPEYKSGNGIPKSVVFLQRTEIFKSSTAEQRRNIMTGMPKIIRILFAANAKW